MGGSGVKLDEVNIFTKAQRGNRTTLSYSPSVTPDFSSSNRFEISLTGDVTIENPSNLGANQSGMIYVEQDNTGGRTVTWGNQFKPTSTFSEDTSPYKVAVYSYEVYSTSQIVITHVMDL